MRMPRLDLQKLPVCTRAHTSSKAHLGEHARAHSGPEDKGGRRKAHHAVRKLAGHGISQALYGRGAGLRGAWSRQVRRGVDCGVVRACMHNGGRLSM